MSTTAKGNPLGCLIIFIFGLWLLFSVVIPGAWHFLEASWPTWAFLLLAIILLTLVRAKKEKLFFKATDKVLTPIAAALAALMTLELLFGLFKSFFNANRVGSIEDAILRAHFAIARVEHSLGYFIPVAVSISVAFLCLSVGDWKYSSGLAKMKDAFRFLSLALLVLASFTFFGGAAANVLLDWEKDQNQTWYKMELADEDRSLARLIASRELYHPISQLDANSKKNFETFFNSLKNICKRSKCFRGEFELDLNSYDNPSAEAFDDTIEQKVLEDFAQLLPPNNDLTGAAKSSHDALPSNNLLADILSRSGRIPSRRVGENHPADVDLNLSNSPHEKLLSRRASSQEEREEQRRTIFQQRERSHRMKDYEWEAKHKITEAFAAALTASVPDAEGIVGAYLSELIDDAAEWIVRPLVDLMYKQGYRPETIQDLHLAIEAVPPTMNDTFSKFHATGTRSSEISHFDKAESVDSFFENEQKSTQKFKMEMVETQKELERRREEERGREP
jgi:hypothetical protein